MTVNEALVRTPRLVQRRTITSNQIKVERLTKLISVFQNHAKSAEKDCLENYSKGFRRVRYISWQAGLATRSYADCLTRIKRYLTEDISSLKIDASSLEIGYLRALQKSLEIVQKEIEDFSK